ncbi:unnamed protein product [Linum trigynum]|uniref:Uncharacterized protein n=1 Tax=Linum trigynum TaxID=586398 RepID=A0AAV2FDY1_9ROSI
MNSAEQSMFPRQFTVSWKFRKRKRELWSGCAKFPNSSSTEQAAIDGKVYSREKRGGGKISCGAEIDAISRLVVDRWEYKAGQT